ncbi:nucleotidyl transferase AbiEii/AbiGii toxin family protein [Aliagarivorans taiwanensis]|uniref:nucleotidyl transferase AbiEii/AbiGii toxin family protein n=1 Tax=Aliagarivorans taiwanensis TaxID=561966 RepID=UPI000551B9CD|nr:nucleotidyl transferase AbiEii/AbiGii toxin family protein [Aliagarivorans taiwanensis]
MTEHEVLLSTIADALGEELLNQVTFVGGATVSLHLDDAQPIDIRSTKDVDFIVSVTSYTDYHKLVDLLKEKGFSEEIPQKGETAPLCRFICNGVLVDVMPDDEEVLGFSNKWFKACQKNPIVHELPITGTRIQIAQAKYLLATKLEAFFHRGTDILESKDAEDIVVLVNGRDTLVTEIAAGPDDLSGYISEGVRRFKADPSFDYLLVNALQGEEPERYDIISERFAQLSNGG